jgi:hypothetical protein
MHTVAYDSPVPAAWSVEPLAEPTQDGKIPLLWQWRKEN